VVLGLRLWETSVEPAAQLININELMFHVHTCVPRAPVRAGLGMESENEHININVFVFVFLFVCSGRVETEAQTPPCTQTH